MEHTTSLRKKALDWWVRQKAEDGYRLWKIHFPEKPYHSVGITVLNKKYEEIETIYLKEHPIESSCDYDVENDPVILGQFAEAQVSKEEETVKQFIEQWSKDNDYFHVFISFRKPLIDFCTATANWQKEKDRVLISELLKIIETLSESANSNDYSREFKSEIRKSITKAEIHLNKQ